MHEDEILEYTLERDDNLPLRFMGTLLCKYKSRHDATYTLYMTSEETLGALYVFHKVEDSYANGLCNSVITFWEQDTLRDHIIDELGSYESLCFQRILGLEEVELLE